MTMTEDTTLNGAVVPVGGFDYDALSQDVANAARDGANRIRDHQSTMEKAGTEYGRGLIAIGRELIAIKDSLPHGHWSPWLEAEFGMSSKTAQNFMNMARFLADKPETVFRFLSQRTLILLAAPSTPEPVRNELVQRAQAGEKIGPKEIMRSRRQARGDGQAKLHPQKTKTTAADAEAVTAATRAADILIGSLGEGLADFLQHLSKAGPYLAALLEWRVSGAPPGDIDPALLRDFAGRHGLPVEDSEPEMSVQERRKPNAATEPKKVAVEPQRTNGQARRIRY